MEQEELFKEMDNLPEPVYEKIEPKMDTDAINDNCKWMHIFAIIYMWILGAFPQKGDYGYVGSEQETSYKKQESSQRPVRSMARFDRAFMRSDKSSYFTE